jgi:hypothetical protein
MNEPTTIIGKRMDKLTSVDIAPFVGKLAAIQYGTSIVLAVADTPEELDDMLKGEKSRWCRMALTNDEEMNELFLEARRKEIIS